MRIGIIIENFYPAIGGPYSAIKETIKELAKKKIHIKLIFKNKRNKNSLSKSIRNLDICHFYGGWTFFYLWAAILAFRFKKKIIIHPFGIYEPWAFSQKRIKKIVAWHLYQKHILKKADIIHCVSSMEEKNLLKLNSDFRTIVLPYGISDNIIKKRGNKKFSKRALFLSRLHPKKGLTELIKAWLDVNNKNWKLDIIGPHEDKNYFNSLVQLINNSGNKNIRLLKPVFNNSKKYNLFSNYNFFVLPTKSDPFGMVILESLSRGLPVLTNNNTPWKDIKFFNAGWFIKDSYSELKTILKKIFNTTEHEFYIKSQNALYLANKFNWKYISERYIQMYRDLFRKKF